MKKVKYILYLTSKEFDLRYVMNIHVIYIEVMNQKNNGGESIIVEYKV